MEWKNDYITNPKGFQSNDPIEWAEDFASRLVKKEDRVKPMTTTQLRKFFGQLKRIQAEGYNEKNKPQFLMLKAQLAYAAGRDKGNSKLTLFKDQISEAINLVEKASNNEEEKIRFKNFVNLVEAIVAYHKAKGGD